MGRRNDTYVHCHRLRRANAQHFALLNHPQQAGLRLKWHLTNLIQKQRAAVRQLKLTGRAAASRAGKSTIDIAKQLALHQIARQRATVDGDKRLLRAQAGIVDRLSKQLFAGAALAGQQNGAVTAAAEASILNRLLQGGSLALNHLKGVAGADAQHAPGNRPDTLVLAQGKDTIAVRGGHQRHQTGYAAARRHKLQLAVIAERQAQQRSRLWLQLLINCRTGDIEVAEHLARIAIKGFDTALTIEHDNAFVQRFQN